MNKKALINKGVAWFKTNQWKPFEFQLKAWNSFLQGKSGIINAPTGSGKTYSLFVPIALDAIRHKKAGRESELQAIWITPLRALTKEIQYACSKASKELGLDWKIEIRTGDTKQSARKKQLSAPPQMLITTPESMHVLFSTMGYKKILKDVQSVVVDEWHELMGSKRGVQTELALSRLKALNPDLKIWGVSATIGNLDEAMDVLLGPNFPKTKCELIRSLEEKIISVESIFPDEIEKYPWSGHLGIKLLHKVVPIIKKNRSTLIFTNTRSQCEIWYQKILSVEPDLSGTIAMHHGSISRDLRDWVEEALHEGKLKAVVCTSSLDLGVDFRPVETIVQIGSPKGVSRFIQRAGRSGHQPGAISKIYFVPTHSLELVEGAALRSAINQGVQEDRIPYIRSFDVLVQYLMSLAVSGGFSEQEIYNEIKSTHCYNSITPEEWAWVLNFLVYGGKALEAYDEYRKVAHKNGIYKVEDPYIARKHKLSIGTISSDVSMQIKFVNGRKIGEIEEYFVSQLNPGNTFWFAGLSLELIRVNGLTAYVRKANKKTGRIPSWLGARMTFSSRMSKMIRSKLYSYSEGIIDEMEMELLIPLLEQQRKESYLPKANEFLIEYFQSNEGYHLLLYPFEGRFVHEGIGALIAKRIANKFPVSFSIAMNDYGLELLANKPLDIFTLINKDLFGTKNLTLDIQASLNSVEMARRMFRDIAKISGLIFRGYPGKQKKEKHLQTSSQLLFDVFKDYDPDNLLYLQTYDELLTFQLEETRMREALNRIQKQELIISTPKKYTPFSFPIVVDRLREKLTSEKLEERIRKMTAIYSE